MQERYYCMDDRASSGFRKIENLLADSSKRIALTLAEREKKIAEIKTCPGPCVNGKVSVGVRSSAKHCEQEVPCPVISMNCAYGIAMRKHRDRTLTELMVAKIGAPRRHVVRLSRFTETIATREAARWSMSGFLVLSGKTGCGKSFAAAWFVNRYLKKQIETTSHCESWELQKLQTVLENTASSVMWSSAQSIVEDKNIATCAKQFQLLVLDDLGKECGLESTQAALRDVICKRYDNELPTLITTELTIPDIAAQYGRAIAERIVGEEEDGGKFVTCGDVSLRLITRSKEGA
ncbi:hypothetical protein LJC31_08150 [Synergistaceae bacterium OttesenSCG-928-I11]|nr:hypothetical protein [Synergistaceae bacterium OttesenSCG-928-I11]